MRSLLEELGFSREDGLKTKRCEEELIVRDILSELAREQSVHPDEFFKEDCALHNMFLSDFWIPSANLLLEINELKHFYPYTRKAS